MKKLPTIVISQTGTLTDVLFTFPLAYVMRQHKENQCKIVLIAQEQARHLVEACQWIDVFLSKEQVMADASLLLQYQPQIFMATNNDVAMAKLARKASISVRVADRKYWRNWLNFNKLVNISVLKGKPVRHQMQRIVALAGAFKANIYFSAEILTRFLGLEKQMPLPQRFAAQIDSTKFNLLINLSNPIEHLQWPLEKFLNVAEYLDNKQFNVFFIASKPYELPDLPLNIHNFTGRLALPDMMALIAATDGIVATNTLELHIASSLQKYTLGLYNNAFPYNPTNQKPAGDNATVLVEKKYCKDCQRGKSCQCLQDLSVEKVLNIVREWPNSVQLMSEIHTSPNTP